MDWEEQYKSPKWQKLRLRVFEEAEFKCAICGASETELHAHHINYKKGKMVWEYEEDELLCLCSVCHKIIHVMCKFIQQSTCRFNLHQRGRLAGYIYGLKQQNEGYPIMPVKLTTAAMALGYMQAWRIETLKQLENLIDIKQLAAKIECDIRQLRRVVLNCNAGINGGD